MKQSIFENTGGLLSAPGRPTKGAKPKVRRILSFSMTDKDSKFLDSYCKILGMTRTEVILRGLSCLSGYNGRNGKEVLNSIQNNI